MDIQEINIGESTTIPKLNVIENESSGLNGKKSVNFGPGADLLMNPKKQNQTPNTKSDMELSDINEIDIGGNSLKEARNSLFSDIGLKKDDDFKINFGDDNKIGGSSSDSSNFIKKDIKRGTIFVLKNVGIYCTK